MNLFLGAVLWAAVILGGKGPPGAVDIWLTTYAPVGVTTDGGNVGMGIGYYRLFSYWWDWDYYGLCNDTGSTVFLGSRIEWEQAMGAPQKPPVWITYPSELTIEPWSCAGYAIVLDSGAVEDWSLWDVFVLWDKGVANEARIMN